MRIRYKGKTYTATQVVRRVRRQAAFHKLSQLPIDEHLMLFEGNLAFEDNGRALFLEMVERGIASRYRIVWFVNDPAEFAWLQERYGVEVEKYIRPDDSYSEAEFRRFAELNCTAKWCLYSNAFLGSRDTPGQRRVLLLHGVGLKDTLGIMGDAKRHTDVLCTSELTRVLNDKNIPGSYDGALPTGLPRNDWLFKHDANADEYFDQLPGKHHILWMPTFKRNSTDKERNDFSAERASDVSLLTPEFMAKLNDRLEKNDCSLLIKFHPFQDLSYVNFFDLSNISTISNEVIEKRGICLYSLIGRFDALVSDFSSVVYDYMLLDRPMAFDLTDMDAYKDGLGFSVDNPLDYMPGNHMYTEDDFLEFVDQIGTGEDPFADARHKVTREFHDHIDGHSSERVLQALGLI